jgi:hypothetical protein
MSQKTCIGGLCHDDEILTGYFRHVNLNYEKNGVSPEWARNDSFKQKGCSFFIICVIVECKIDISPALKKQKQIKTTTGRAPEHLNYLSYHLQVMPGAWIPWIAL